MDNSNKGYLPLLFYLTGNILCTFGILRPFCSQEYCKKEIYNLAKKGKGPDLHLPVEAEAMFLICSGLSFLVWLRESKGTKGHCHGHNNFSLPYLPSMDNLINCFPFVVCATIILGLKDNKCQFGRKKTKLRLQK